MKTPDEIKKGLKHCPRCVSCTGCTYDEEEDNEMKCLDTIMDDALAYIEQLESRLAQVERERDALMESVKGCCETCAFVGDCTKHDPDPTSTGAWWYDDCEEWQWRGVCPENTKEEN